MRSRPLLYYKTKKDVEAQSVERFKGCFSNCFSNFHHGWTYPFPFASGTTGWSRELRSFLELKATIIAF